MNFQERVWHFMERGQLCNPSQKILVALSGGADSVALFRVLLQLNYIIEAVHCNFHLRGEESMRDQRFVEDLCERHHVECHTAHFQTETYAKEQGISIEMAARDQRYRVFEDIRSKCGAAYTAVAHNSGDSVETLLLNLMRGTGIRGLTGIKAKNGHIIRPLLSVSRSDITAYLQGLGQDWITDSTNLQTDFTRNKIRLQLLPLMRSINPGVESSILRTAEHLSDSLDIYSQCMEEARSRVVTRHGQTITINTEALMKEVSPRTLLFEILHPLGFSESRISDIFSSIDSEPGREFLSGEWRLVKDRNAFLLQPEVSGQFAEMEMELHDGACIMLPDGRRLSVEYKTADDLAIVKDPAVAMLSADTLPTRLTLRKVRKADTFIPFGMKGRKLLSDYMTDRKFSLHQKREQLLLCHGERVLWVVGHRIDNRYAITPHTKRVLVMRLTES